MTVGRAAPRAAPVLEAGQFDRRLLNEVLDNVLFAQPVTATHGIVEVVVEAVVRTLDTRGATFGGDGMATHRIDLRYQRDLQRRIRFGNCDSCTQTGSAPSHDNYICLVNFHAQSFLA